MDHPFYTTFLLLAGLLLSVVALWRGWRPSLRTALAVGIALRLFLLINAAADSWQPLDFVDGFKPAGQAILAHQDPVLATHGSWHFLPMIPYLYALGLRAGLPWEIAGRLVTVAADIALIPLVGRLAGEKNAAAARFAYACSPIALMVAVIHGQIEPVALVFLVAAYVMARSGRGGWAGALFGFALSAGTWPVILLPPLLAMLPNWRERVHSVVMTGVVPVFFLVTMPLVVHVGWVDLLHVARYLGGVRPVVGEWGWTAWMTGGNWALAPTAAGIGQVVLYLTLLAVMWLWRRADRVDMTSAILLAFLIVTPRMGAQYLLWVVPFLVARPTRFSRPALWLAALWAGLGYIYLTHFDDAGWWQNHQWWSRSSVAVIALLILAMPWGRRTPAETEEPATVRSQPLPAGH
ncbi:glycosyltransferase 87 family protein [Actinomadura sp. DC4]|uniref:glycosyltransferase 87 family protein n=1 Tax=Actinomadura sp. DC4 TaxID=3055069 RepID=UPI0025B0B8CE|nr:glycosyltransferase 87 family protein [Actinomadura sp. DC4]MDN3354848.1 glycosyltransferase 87 family protein [Actinomadura sp. DC4]